LRSRKNDSKGEDHIVLEYTYDYPLHRGMVVIVVFDDDKIKGENTYYSSEGTRDVGSLPAPARREESRASRSRRRPKAGRA
jgi:hypothetical protein